MEVACAMELRPSPKPLPQMVGAYDPPSNDLASKSRALEGYRITREQWGLSKNGHEWVTSHFILQYMPVPIQFMVLCNNPVYAYT